MYRKIMMAVVALPMAGCAGLFPGSGGVDPGVVTQVQSFTMGLCAFLPTAVTIAEIIGKHSPGLDTATAVATAICQAVIPVKPAPATNAALTANSPFLPRVAGVPIEGKWIRSF